MEDLRFIQETLEQVHPSLLGEASVSALRTYANEIIAKVNGDIPSWQVAILAQQLLHFPKGAHTSSDISAGNRHFLPVSFYWVADGLLIFPADSVDIPSASEVVQLGRLTTQNLEQKLSELVSGNVYWVRASSTELLVTETILRYLDVLE